MADLKTTLKQAWLKTMESVGTAASNIASSTRQRLDEMNLINRRREILADLSNRAYELWQKGVTFPTPMQELLEELTHVDEALNTLRTEKLAGVNTAEPQAPATEKSAAPAQEAAPVTYAMPTMDVPPAEEAPKVETKPLEDSIDTLMSGVAEKVDEAAKQVDAAVEEKAQEAGTKMQGVLDALEEHVVTFGEHLGKSIDSLANELNSDDKNEEHKDDPQA